MKQLKYILLLSLLFLGADFQLKAETANSPFTIRLSESGIRQSNGAFAGSSMPYHGSSSAVISGGGFRSVGAVSSIGGGSRLSSTTAPTLAGSGLVAEPTVTLQSYSDPLLRRGFGGGGGPDDRPEVHDNPIGDLPWLLLGLCLVMMLIGKIRNGAKMVL